MNHTFDYASKILLAVEFATEPHRLAGALPGYAIFRRVGILEIIRTFEEDEKKNV
jgi:hypothetical protein